MIAYLWYTLKASACLVVLYSFYSLFLRKNTFFTLNRLYLVTGLFLSFIIPIVKISIFKEQVNFVLPTEINKILVASEYDFFQSQNFTNGLNTFNYFILLPVIYISGISILFFRLLFSIIKVNRIKNSSEIYQCGKFKIVKVDAVIPFSFFNMIFLSKNENNPLIINHEMEHIKQFHWIDLILAEIVSVLLWFNPFVVLYKRSLKLQHEYLADYKVVRNSNLENYLGCMLKNIQIVSLGRLTSHFYCKTIKKRIIMITKNKTSFKYLAVYLLALPLMCMLLYAFTESKSKPVFLPNTKINYVVDEYTPSIYPLDIVEVKTQTEYGERIHPVYKVKKFHSGVDFAASEGVKVISTAAGTVVETNYDSRNGNYILIKHSDEFSTFYSHLKNATAVAGAKVTKGGLIGYLGSTGLSTNPHLHYEVIKNGKRVDPKNYLPK